MGFCEGRCVHSMTQSLLQSVLSVIWTEPANKGELGECSLLKEHCCQMSIERNSFASSRFINDMTCLVILPN